ncbi:hypothetical protein ACOZ4N_19700 [Halorientalis pallida]|uniref:hypothetical protein n=1 Tax=Halorientalis pallida TaxID=2479928 RepID=UPI003C6FE284
MVPLHDPSARDAAVLAGVACALATTVALVASSITVSLTDPALLSAALAYVAIGTGVVATVSLFLFADRSLLSPALVGGGYLLTVYGGFVVTGGTAPLEALLSRWPWAFAAVLALGIVEYLIRYGLSTHTAGGRLSRG